jgi:hypothetical protein
VGTGIAGDGKGICKMCGNTRVALRFTKIGASLVPADTKQLDKYKVGIRE